MTLSANDLRQQAHTKIRTRIVAALEKEFGMIQTPELQIEFCNHVDTWLSIPPNFSKSELSDEKILAAVEKEFRIEFEHGAFVRFGEDQQGSDVWLPIPPNFLKGELSEDEIQAVAGKSIMIRWNIVSGKFKREAESGELMQIGFGIFPAKFF